LSPKTHRPCCRRGVPSHLRPEARVDVALLGGKTFRPGPRTHPVALAGRRRRPRASCRSGPAGRARAPRQSTPSVSHLSSGSAPWKHKPAADKAKKQREPRLHVRGGIRPAPPMSRTFGPTAEGCQVSVLTLGRPGAYAGPWGRPRSGGSVGITRKVVPALHVVSRGEPDHEPWGRLLRHLRGHGNRRVPISSPAEMSLNVHPPLSCPKEFRRYLG